MPAQNALSFSDEVPSIWFSGASKAVGCHIGFAPKMSTQYASSFRPSQATGAEHVVDAP